MTKEQAIQEAVIKSRSQFKSTYYVVKTTVNNEEEHFAKPYTVKGDTVIGMYAAGELVKTSKKKSKEESTEESEG
jgi:hypothetical protein